MNTEILCKTKQGMEEKTIEVLGDYTIYKSGWCSNHEIDCARIVTREDGYYVIPFGREADGFDYEDESIGPFITKNEACKKAAKLLQEEKELS